MAVTKCGAEAPTKFRTRCTERSRERQGGCFG
jgi:hypothetical protein